MKKKQQYRLVHRLSYNDCHLICMSISTRTWLFLSTDTRKEFLPYACILPAPTRCLNSPSCDSVQSTGCQKPVVFFFITLTDEEGMRALCSILPHPQSQPNISIISLRAERSAALILAIVPLEFGSCFSWSGSARLCHCSLLLPSIWGKRKASLKLVGDKLLPESHWAKQARYEEEMVFMVWHVK